MPFVVHYDVDGADKAEHRLLGMAARAVEPRPVLEHFADTLENKMRGVFAVEGPGWAPLSPVTVARKGSSTIGRDTDAMMASLTDSGAEGALREYLGNELIFGTNLTTEEGVNYPAIFDKGRQDGSQPARPLIQIDGSDLRAFSKALQVYLVGLDRAEFGVGDFGSSITSVFGA